jgi:hypothetical protein
MIDILKIRIELLQGRLYKLLACRNILDPEVIYLSKRLDILINKADRLQLQDSGLEKS